jgi:predicted dehydrogenase
MSKIKTAVIGVGKLGRHHTRWLKSIDQSELVGVYDIDQSKCREVAGEYSVPPFDNLETLCNKVEAVSIAATTSAHYEIAERMINRGIHCLIEKPVTATVDEAEKLLKLIHDKPVVVAVGHIERFNPAVQALKDYDIRPRFIEAHRLAAFDPRGTDVAVILDLMIHDIELALYLVDSGIERLEASAVAVISERADIANARLTFKNGAVANLTASRISLKPMRKLRIFQQSGYFSLDLAARRADIYRLLEDAGDDDTGMKFPLGKSGKHVLYNKAGAGDEDMLAAELTDFLAAVADRRAPEVGLAEAVEALRTAAAIENIGTNGVTI